MSHDEKNTTRRSFLKTSLGTLGTVAGTLAAGPVFGQMLSKETPRQVLGPYYPDDGDPEVEIRERMDFSGPIAEGNDNDLTFVKGKPGKAKGQVIYLRGQVKGTRVMTEKDFSMGEEVLPGATIILWQCSQSGRYNHKGDGPNFSFKHPDTGEMVHRTHDENFQYWGRALTDEDGRYWFKTIVPGFYPIYGGFRTAHLHMMISAPGYPQLVTQAYFRGKDIENIGVIEDLNAKDFVLHDEKNTPEQRERLVVEYKKDPTGKITDGLVGEFDITLIQ